MTNKTRNSGEWTESRYFSFIKSGLRSKSTKWPPKYKTLNEACVGKKTNQATGRLAKHYKCAECGEHFPAKEVAVDHINPVVDPAVGFTSWDELIERMFCEADGLQVLCKGCHKIKSAEERTIAVERRRKEKDNL